MPPYLTIGGTQCNVGARLCPKFKNPSAAFAYDVKLYGVTRGIAAIAPRGVLTLYLRKIKKLTVLNVYLHMN